MKNRTIILLEEIFNSITHGVAFLLVIIGLVVFFLSRRNLLNTTEVAGVGIFGASLLFLYIMSTLFHSLYSTKAKKVFAIFDRMAIYLLIAGTYTPFMVSVVKGTLGVVMLVVIWLLAVVGIILQPFAGEKYKKISTVFYLMMGWLVIAAIKPILGVIQFHTLIFLLIGGLAYSSGIFFYAFRKMPFNHTVWHVFVMGGSICHFLPFILFKNL